MQVLRPVLSWREHHHDLPALEVRLHLDLGELSPKRNAGGQAEPLRREGYATAQGTF